jgi:hypothetical protein
MVVVATKLDATTNREHLEELRAFATKRGLLFYSISSASGAGIVELVRGLANALDRIPKPAPAVQPEVASHIPPIAADQATPRAEKR